MRRILLVLGLILFLGSYQTSLAAGIDSLRLETIDGQSFIIHQVDPGETLYAISKRYQCSMNAIAEASPEVKKGLHNNMILRIPYNPTKTPKPAAEKVHIVRQGETLYSISNIYDVSVIDIMEWNDLMSADLEIDQRLTIKGEAAQAPVEYVLDGMRIHVIQPGEGLYAIARQYDVSVDQLVEWNELSSSALNLGQELIVGRVGASSIAVVATNEVLEEETEVEPIVEETKSEEAVVAAVAITSDKPHLPMAQKKENGLASAIEGSSETATYLAMHRTIPVGSLVAVRNEMNSQVVFVRVIGVLPDTGVNDKIIIRLSSAAVEQLRVIDPKFRVEITYFVPED